MYTKIDDLFWKDAKMKSRSDDAKMVFLYLLTCPHRTMTGMYHLPIGYASADMGWKPERFAKGFAELFQNGFINHDEGAEVVFVRNYLKYNKIENPNQATAALKSIDNIPANSCDADLMRVLQGFDKGFLEPLVKRLSERLSKRYAKPETETEAEVYSPSSAMPDDDVKSSEPQKIANEFFESVWSLYPRKQGKASVSAAQKKKLMAIGYEKLSLAINRYKATTRDPQYYMHGDRFFNKGYVDFIGDEPAESTGGVESGLEDWTGAGAGSYWDDAD